MADVVHSLWERHCEAHTKDAVQGEVIGTIPSWLNGRLIRNGVGEKRVGDSHFNHLFDGMALLHMVNIEDGKVSYTSRFLESDTYTMNHRANRIIVTEFGTLGVPDPCLSLFGKFSALFFPRYNDKMTDNCLVNVLQVKDELLAMTESDTVRIIDPATLDTKKEKYTYSDHVAIQRATAHPHVGEDSTVYNLGFSLPNKVPCYTILSIPNGKIDKAKIEAEIPCRWRFNPGYLHSFGMSENYFIITENPLALDVFQMLKPPITGMTTYKALKYHKNKNTIFRVMSRKTGQELSTNYVSPDFFNFHFINCFEAKGCLIVDVCATDDNIMGALDMVNIGRKEKDAKKTLVKLEPRRYVVPIDNIESAPVGEEILKNIPEAKLSRTDLLASASAVKRSDGSVFLKGIVISETSADLPRINYRFNTKPYKYAYCARIEDYRKSFLDFDSLLKVNVQTGEEKIWQDKEYYTSEPVFVERPDPKGEDDGAVITILIHKTNHRKLAFLVLDAVSLTEIARVNFLATGTVTPTFHGQFMKAEDKSHSL